MALEVVAQGGGHFDSANALGDHAITIPDVPNRVLYAAIASNADLVNAVTAVTFGGSATGWVKVHDAAPSPAFQCTQLWRLINPPTGAANFNGTITGDPLSGAIKLVCVRDCDQSTPNGSVVTNASEFAGEAEANISVTSEANDLVIDFVGYTGGEITDQAEGSGQTELTPIFEEDIFYGILSSTKAGEATTAIEWDFTSHRYYQIGVNLNYSPGGSVPTVTDVDTDELVYAGQTGVVVTGTVFGASQGSGSVVISPTDDIDDVDAVAQTVTAWADTSITITVVRGSLDLDTTLYLFVENDADDSNAAGRAMQIVARPYVRETLIDLNGAAVASVTDITMLVYHTLPATAVAPNERVVVATNGSGQINQVISRGALALDAPVWIILMKEGSPARGSARKVTPVYE